jgi:mannan endo-1,4-beta-mannosidase
VIVTEHSRAGELSRPLEARSFVEVDGAQMRCGGAPFRFVGFNCYYLMAYAADEGVRHHVDGVLEAAARTGLDVCRTWAFNEGAAQWNALRVAPGRYDERVFRGLDYVVWRAGRLGLRLILTLTNNWIDYGGMYELVGWSPTAREHDDFYADPICRRLYVEHVERLAGRRNHLTGTRYRDDPTIMAWELANEPRCPTDLSGARLNRWIEWAAAEVAARAPRQLVTVGSEGFYRPGRGARNPPRWRDGQGCDFVSNHAAGAVDFAGFHVYPDHWDMDPLETLLWIEDHLELARRELGKPVVVGELGRRGSRRDRDFARWLQMVRRDARSGGAAAGSCVWSLYHADYPDYDGFGIYLDRDLATSALLGGEADRIAR